jgi:hypothetical protein
MDLAELQGMTVVRLREEALKHDSITSVHGMNKEQIIEALAPIYGIDLEAQRRAMRERLAANKGTLKREIHTYKSERNMAVEDHDAEGSARARKEIKKRKRRLRHMAKTATS